jgi:hypothetical protein
MPYYDSKKNAVVSKWLYNDRNKNFGKQIQMNPADSSCSYGRRLLLTYVFVLYTDSSCSYGRRLLLTYVFVLYTDISCSYGRRLRW